MISKHKRISKFSMFIEAIIIKLVREGFIGLGNSMFPDNENPESCPVIERHLPRATPHQAATQSTVQTNSSAANPPTKYFVGRGKVNKYTVQQQIELVKFFDYSKGQLLKLCKASRHQGEAKLQR